MIIRRPIAHGGRAAFWESQTLPSWARPSRSAPSSLLKKVFEVSRWATLIQDPSARRTKDSQPSGFGFEYCASHVGFRVFQQTARLLYLADVPVESYMHGSSLVYRLFESYPAEKLLIVEGLYESQADRRLPNVQYCAIKS